MISVKQAVRNAAIFLREMYESSAIGDVRLEEVELSDDQQEWHVTLSFAPSDAVTQESPFSELLSLPRQYKVIAVSAETGDVRSMKIRTLT
jgi:hypothetical protein